MTSMYHDGQDMWSDLWLLADAADMDVEEEQQRLRRLAEKGEESKCHKTVSEEEDRQKRVFCLFPRKTRSSLVKRRYMQQNPKGVSIPPSSLLDLNLITTGSDSDYSQNPSSDESMVCDEELRAKKGKSVMVCKDDDEEENEKRLFELEKSLKKLVRLLQQNFDILNGASTSSSFLNLCCDDESSLLLKSEKIAETTDPPNPNYQSSSPSSCLAENTSRKRRAVQQKKKSGNFKKAKVVPFPRVARETPPEWVFQVMREMNADAEYPRLIFERSLTASDVKSDQSRLLIPFSQLFRNDFLAPAECRAIEKNEANQNDENIGVGTILVNQRSEKWGLRFKIWAMEKDSGHGTLYYALNLGWNDVVKGNDLRAGHKISLWIFRCRGVLCFALET